MELSKELRQGVCDRRFVGATSIFLEAHGLYKSPQGLERALGGLRVLVLVGRIAVSSVADKFFKSIFNAKCLHFKLKVKDLRFEFESRVYPLYST